MADVDLTYTIGTVSVDDQGTVVTGETGGMLWSQSPNVRQWDWISIDGSDPVPIVASAADDLHLSIPTWKGGAKAGVTYVIYQISPLRYVGGQAMADVDDMLQKLNTEGWYRYVNPAFAGPTEQGIVANEGQFALKFTTGQLWIMTGGVWVLVGVFKGFGVPAPYDNTKVYNINDVASVDGSTYAYNNAVSASGNPPPDPTHWTVLASKGDVGDAGPVPFKPIAPWVTGTNFVIGPPADFVSENGSAYECLMPHMSGTFATDLTAGKWGLVVAKGEDGAGTGDMKGANNLSDVDDAATSRLNLGINQSVAIGSAVDFNTISANGSYYAIAANNPNSPVSGGQYYLEVVNDPLAPTTFLMQRATDLSSAAVFSRVATSGVWTAWKPVPLSGEIGKIEFWPTSDLRSGRLKANAASVSRTTFADLLNELVKTGAATFTNGSSNVGMPAHGRSVGDPIKLFTSGGLPTNFTAGTHGLVTVGTNYVVKSVVDANNVTLALTIGGTAIVAGSAGSGTHSWVCAPHGDGDGATTFTLPELRGEFIRAWDNGRGIDNNRVIGDLQLDALQGHVHISSINGIAGSVVGNPGPGVNNTPNTAGVQTGPPVSDGTNGTPRTGPETRPRNVSVLATIRYAA